MNMKSKVFLFVLMTVSSGLPLGASCWDKKTPGEKCFIVSAAGAVVVGGTYLLYKLFTWEPSNEHLLARAQRRYEELHGAYQSIELKDNEEMLIRYTEQDLGNMSFNRDMMILAHADSDLRVLQNERDTLRARLRRDGGKCDIVLDEMRELLTDIKKLEGRLKLFKQFWSEYSGFFELYYYFNTVADRYEDIRADVYDVDLVRRTIMATSVNTNQSYPYLHFAETLKRDVDGLAYRMNNARRYDVMHGKAERLHDPLVGLLATVASMPEYKEELHLKKQHQLEQERVDAMREKAEAERMKAAALAQQAAAEREKANAMHAQAFATLVKPAAQHHVNVHVGGRDGGGAAR